MGACLGVHFCSTSVSGFSFLLVSDVVIVYGCPLLVYIITDSTIFNDLQRSLNSGY